MNVEVVDTPLAVNDSGAFGEFVTSIVQLKEPVDPAVHVGDAPVVTLPGFTAVNVIVPGTNPDPVAVSVAGSVPLLGVKDHEEMGAKVVAEGCVVTVSKALKVCAPEVAAETVIMQEKLPVASVLQPAPTNDTPTSVEKTTGSFAVKPVPVPVRVAGSV